MSASGPRGATSRTARLAAAGVSIWLDDLSRDRIVSGGLAELVATRDVVGITTNPTIFARALQDSAAYDEEAAALAAEGCSVDDAVLALTTADVAAAADLLRPVHDATDGLDGWVSIEVGAAVAHDTDATMAEVHRLVAAVDRPNVFIKIPATAAGVDAIREATAAGISVNVTLIFRLARYDQVVDAYLSGLERAAADGRDLGRIRSVASFFVSRVDTAIDARLAAVGTPEAERLRGRAGVANARLAYERFEQAFASERARALLERGATKQRPLWASTGVKDARLRDTMYVEELIAPHVVNTMPEKTLQAFADHGEVRGDTIAGTAVESRAVLDRIAVQGISYDEVTEELERDGVEQFVSAGERLRDAVAGKLTVRA
ncbi:MAG TPA: transaldolase [Amnibacterium sp.]|nr:transaldolase [Amnibacterium sp.]